MTRTIRLLPSWLRRETGSRPSAALSWALLAFAFFLPISISIAEGIIYFVAIPLWIYLVVTRRAPSPATSPFFWPVVLYAAIAIATSITGINPPRNVWACHRLALLTIIFMIEQEIPSGGQGSLPWPRVVHCFLAGCCGLAAYHLTRIFWVYLRSDLSFAWVLQITANMRDPQFFMVALCLLMSLFAGTGNGKWNWLYAAAAALCLTGLLSHLKRGVWLSGALAATLVGCLSARRKVILTGILVFAGLLMATPLTRLRFGQFWTEWDASPGQRWVMWTEVAPRLIWQHPFGLGQRAFQRGDLTKISGYIQPGLDHLHNNFLQIAVETGWLGVSVWTSWMAWAVWLLFRTYRRNSKSGRDETILTLGLLGGLVALLLDGFVEYNFGSSKTLMLFCLLMGLAAAQWKRAIADNRGSHKV